jgi:hypothetical protein
MIGSSPLSLGARNMPLSGMSQNGGGAVQPMMAASKRSGARPCSSMSATKTQKVAASRPLQSRFDAQRIHRYARASAVPDFRPYTISGLNGAADVVSAAQILALVLGKPLAERLTPHPGRVDEKAVLVREGPEIDAARAPSAKTLAD